MKKDGREHPLSWAAVQDADHQRPDPDPGVTWAEPMLVSHVENLRTGMELHRRMAPRGQRDPRRAQRLQGGL